MKTLTTTILIAIAILIPTIASAYQEKTWKKWHHQFGSCKTAKCVKRIWQSCRHQVDREKWHICHMLRSKYAKQKWQVKPGSQPSGLESMVRFKLAMIKVLQNASICLSQHSEKECYKAASKQCSKLRPSPRECRYNIGKVYPSFSKMYTQSGQLKRSSPKKAQPQAAKVAKKQPSTKAESIGDLFTTPTDWMVASVFLLLAIAVIAFAIVAVRSYKGS